MKAPPGSTIIATPLANCWFDQSLMCIDNINCDRTRSNVTIHYRILGNVVGHRKLCWLKIFPACDVFDDEVRQMAAAALPAICQALAIVTPAGHLGSVAASYCELKKKGFPVAVFTDEDEARRWLNSRC